jgi:hypothetical protein
MLLKHTVSISIHLSFLEPVSDRKKSKQLTPVNKELENSILSNFATSLLREMSKKGGDCESTGTHNEYVSSKAGNGEPTTESGRRKSCRKRRKHKHKKSTTLTLNVVKTDNVMHSGNISDLGGTSKVFIGPWNKPPEQLNSRRVMDNSLEVEKDEMNTQRTIDVKMKRRRSRTNDLISGIALQTRLIGNFIEDEISFAEDTKTDM